MSSVTERYEGTTNNNERVGRNNETDFTGWKSADGFVTIVNRKEGRSYVWVAVCTKPGCGCTGIVFPHEYLVGGGVIKCSASGHDSATTEPVVRQHAQGVGVQQRVKEDIVFSPRQRAEMKARAAEQKAFEEEQ